MTTMTASLQPVSIIIVVVVVLRSSSANGVGGNRFAVLYRGRCALWNVAGDKGVPFAPD